MHGTMNVNFIGFLFSLGVELSMKFSHSNWKIKLCIWKW